jgi:hypothetical protein
MPTQYRLEHAPTQLLRPTKYSGVGHVTARIHLDFNADSTLNVLVRADAGYSTGVR